MLQIVSIYLIQLTNVKMQIERKVIEAINLAAVAHQNQRRKNAAATPYINHPIEVMYILSQAGITDSSILIAAVLHDVIEPAKLFSQFLDPPDFLWKSGLGVYPVEPDISQPLQELSAPSKVEDCGVTYDYICQQFGKRAGDFVMECSDDKSLPKVERKKQQIEHAKTISNGAKMIKLADKLSNLSALHNDPPLTWSPDVINGYFIWSYAVCEHLKGVCPILDDEINKIFFDRNLMDIPPETLNIILENYYALIVND